MFAEGDRCPVGKVLITLDVEGEGQATAKPGVHAAEAPKAAAAAPAARAGNGAAAASGAVLATPATRKLARDIGVDIREVAGSGRAGRITSDDVRAQALR